MSHGAFLDNELICLAGGLPLRGYGCLCAGGLMLRKQITNRVKEGAEKNQKGF